MSHIRMLICVSMCVHVCPCVCFSRIQSSLSQGPTLGISTPSTPSCSSDIMCRTRNTFWQGLTTISRHQTFKLTTTTIIRHLQTLAFPHPHAPHTPRPVSDLHQNEKVGRYVISNISCYTILDLCYSNPIYHQVSIHTTPSSPRGDKSQGLRPSSQGKSSLQSLVYRI